jgi:hypothetical protein
MKSTLQAKTAILETKTTNLGIRERSLVTSLILVIRYLHARKNENDVKMNYQRPNLRSLLMGESKFESVGQSYPPSSLIYGMDRALFQVRAVDCTRLISIGFARRSTSRSSSVLGML